MVLYQGSSWWSITDAFAEYVLSKKKWIKSQFSIRTFAADEFAVQTIIMNSPFKESRYRPEEGINSNLRLLDFNRGNQYGSPYVWRFSDRDEIKNSPNLIGRKFDETIDKGIVDFVLNKIKHKE